MTDSELQPRACVRLGSRAGGSWRWAGSALFATILLLGACSRTAELPASKLRVYAADVTGGARTCETPKVNPVAGGGSEASMKVVNDGGWCGILVHQDGPKPFDAGLLTTRAAHGNVMIHEVGDDTRIDYTPDHGFSGKDAFVVKLIPGNAAVNVAVTVVSPGT